VPTSLPHGPLGNSCVHLCVDMQGMFAEPTEWSTPWMKRVLPLVVEIAAAHPAATVFTRFIPAAAPGRGQGAWRRYYERWASMTLERLDPGLVELVPELRPFAPPALVVDKHVYAPWLETDLHRILRQRGVDTLVISGAETEVCVLATVMGAVDLGYRVVLVVDAVCSSADATHDAMIDIYHSRYGMQVETARAEEVLEAWK
jgi:nicotinamidase-related amidase